jgi:hypothetical protein
MAVNTLKTTFYIFGTRGKKLNTKLAIHVPFNDNEPRAVENHNLTYPLIRVHVNYKNPSDRTYKLLGIYLADQHGFNHKTFALCKNQHISSSDMQNLALHHTHSRLFTKLHFSLTYCIALISLT